MRAIIFRTTLACFFIASAGIGCLADQPFRAWKIDEFKFTPPYSDCDITARLDEYWKILKDHPELRAYIIGYGGRRQPLSRVAYPPASWKQYLIEMREVAGERVVVVNGGLREEAMVEVWVVPPGVEPPKPTPTVSPKVRRKR